MKKQFFVFGVMFILMICGLTSQLFAQAADSFAVDLSQFTAWDESKTKISKKTNSITFMQSKTGVSQEFNPPVDASAYNSLELTNKAALMGFTVSIEYSDGKITKAYIEEGTTSFLIPLKDKSKKAVSKISVQALEIAGSVRLYSLTFKKDIATSFIYSPDEPVLDTMPAKKINTKITGFELLEDMKVGVNMGNTFESIGGWGNPIGLKSETLWGSPKITPEIIKMYSDAGYKTLRMPVTWANHIIDENYTIDPLWMARVKTVVNWALDAGLYVILNEHHSVRDKMTKPLQHGEGYRTGTGDEVESEQFLRAIWKQIAQAFNNGYDEHLIFETMNEPRNAGHIHAWTPAMSSGKCEECRKDFEILNVYNQACLDEIRKSGGNNATRFVMIPSLCSDGAALYNKYFKMPSDSADGRLIATFHNYIMGSGPEYATPYFTRAMEIQLDALFIKIDEEYTQKGIPVIIGETGAVKTTDLTQRINWINYFVKQAKRYKMLTILWDDGGNFNVFDKPSATQKDPEFIKAMVSAAE